LFKTNSRYVIVLMLTMMVGFFPFQGRVSANSVAVSPSTVELTATPGTPFQVQLEVYGAPDQNLRAKAYLYDYEFDLQGQVVLYKSGGVLPRSAAPWVTVNPGDFLIPAGEKSIITINGVVPEGTPGGDYWSMFFVEIFPFSRLQTTGMVVSGRVGGSFTITVPGSNGPKGKITALDVKCSPGLQKKKISGKINFLNEGDVIVRPSGRVEIRSMDNQVLEEILIPPVKIHPKFTREIAFEEEINLADGSYVALAILDYGGEKLAGYPSVFRVE